MQTADHLIDNFSGTVRVLGVTVFMQDGVAISAVPCHRCENLVPPEDCVAKWSTMQVCDSCLGALQTIADIETYRPCETCGN